MVALKFNRPSPFTINYAGGNQTSITLHPGVTLDIDPKEWSAIALHPIVKIYLDQKLIEVLGNEPSTKHLEVTDRDSETRASFEVIDDPTTGQPMPVLEVGEKADVGKLETSTHQAAKVLPALTLINKAESAEAIAALPTIGKVSARAILQNRPEHGYASLDAVEKANSSLTQANWEEIALWEAAE